MTQQNYAELKSHIDQLWKIIEQQDSQIQELKKTNNSLCNERDELQERLRCSLPTSATATATASATSTQDRSTVRDQESTESTHTMDGTQCGNSNPILPARSPYRAFNASDVDVNSLKDRKQPLSSSSSLSLSPTATKTPAITSPISTTFADNSSNDTTSINDTTDTNPASLPQEPVSPKIIQNDAKLFAQYQSAVLKRDQISSTIPDFSPRQQQQQHSPTTTSPIVLVPSKSSTLPCQSHEARLAQRKQHSSMVFPPTTVIPMAARKKRDDPQPPLPHQQRKDSFSTMNQLNNISDITVKMIGSLLRSNEKGKDVVSFLLSVGKQTGDGFEELWRVQKLYSDFLDLDQKLKSQLAGSKMNKMTRLPEKQLFSTRSPNKLDQRRAALEKYLHHVISLPMDNIADLCEFLSTNVVDRSNDDMNQGNKEGYLTKRGKNFGGWKTRYFSLKKNHLDYYETKDGSKLGSISLEGAQIGRQTPPNSGATEEVLESSYRHAILILEYRRTSIGNYVRHILCANSETDCDEWIAALLQTIQSNSDNKSTTPALARKNSATNKDKLRSKKTTAPSEKQRKLFKGEIRTVSATPISHLRMNSSHQSVDMEKLTLVPLNEGHASSVPLAGNPSPSDAACDTVTSPVPSSSLPLSSPLSMSSLDFPPTPLQQNHFNVFGTSPDKGNPPNGLYYHQQHQQHSLSKINSLEDRAVSPQSRSDSPIPTALLDRRESDDSVTIHDHQQQQHQDKKSKTKSANRMTLWGKKVFGNQQRTLSSPTSPDIISPLTTAGGLSLNTPSSSSSSTGGNPTPPSSSSSSSSTQHQQPTQQSTHHQDQQQQHRAGMQKSLRHILSRPTQHTDGDETHHNDSKPTHNKPLMPTLSKSSPSAPAPIANKLVFGVPLEEAVRISRVSEGYPLPFIVYRCIEYLDAKNAVLEEGLYRLSGSNTMLQKLKKKFNQDGDVPLLQAKEDYDVHVIAGLLKMWLRELPVTVLTRELRPEFIQVIDLLERKDRVNELGRLVSELPLANYTLLRLLTSHLIRVVKHSDINLMTVRNIAIVFSPTLGIPATIFNLFLSEFDYIFWTTKDGDAAPRRFEEEEDDEEDDEDDEDVSKGRPTAPDLDDDNDDNGVSTNEPAQIDLFHHAPHYQASDELLAPISSVVVPRRDNKKHLTIRETHGRNNRNSILYIDAAPNAIVDLEKQTSGTNVAEEEEEEVDDLIMDVVGDDDTQD